MFSCGCCFYLGFFLHRLTRKEVAPPQKNESPVLRIDDSFFKEGKPVYSLIMLDVFDSILIVLVNSKGESVSALQLELLRFGFLVPLPHLKRLLNELIEKGLLESAPEPVCYKQCGKTEPFNGICLNCGSSIRPSVNLN